MVRRDRDHLCAALALHHVNLSVLSLQLLGKTMQNRSECHRVISAVMKLSSFVSGNFSKLQITISTLCILG